MLQIYEYWDETSQYDQHPSKRWNYGGEYFERQYRCFVPIELTEDEIMVWIDENDGNIIWLE